MRKSRILLLTLIIVVLSFLLLAGFLSINGISLIDLMHGLSLNSLKNFNLKIFLHPQKSLENYIVNILL